MAICIPRCSSKGLATYGVHDGVSQLDVADADPRDKGNKAWDNVRVVDVNGLCYGLEAKQQRLSVLGEEDREEGRT